MQPLAAIGPFFQLSDGSDYLSLGLSSFALKQRFDAEGPDACAPVVQQGLDLGYTEFRVFSRFLGGLGTYPGNMDSTRPFCEWMLAQGARVELVVSAAARLFQWTIEQEVAWWNGINERVSGLPNVSLEGVNEWNHPGNQTPAMPYFTNPTVMATRGSGMTDSPTAMPVFPPPLGYGGYHPGRTEDFPRKVGHNSDEDVYQKTKATAKPNEIRRPDENGFKSQDFYDAAADAALLCSGATFHSNEGKAAVVMNGPTLECAAAFIAGARAVDLSVRRGLYTASHLSTCPIDASGLPNSSRIHGKILGNRSCVVITQKPASFQIRPRGGWHVESLQGGSVVTLSR